ncbi:unnamed protein product [Allacma fusca]|uniref:Uncharacterized protein n=1 Tax=Allacma fusca TaxID=39272 RepID=A0A8J2KTG8_9HEXA|nr:unnamed protein product [Allacma fusca]
MSDVLLGEIEILDNEPTIFVSVNPELEVSHSKLCKSRCGISHRLFLIIGIILTSGMTIALIAGKYFDSTSSGGNTGNLEVVETESKGIIPDEHSAINELTVVSATDLKDLTSEQDTIIIEDLDEEYPDSYSLIISEHPNIQNLIIAGPISHKWLKFLLQKLPRVTSLTIHMDEACITTDENNGYNFKSVTNLVLTNLSTSEGTATEWEELLGMCHLITTAILVQMFAQTGIVETVGVAGT